MTERPKYPIIEVIMPWLHERYGDCMEWDSADELVKRLHDAGFVITPRADAEIAGETK